MTTALITGASGGIGYELAKLFAQDHHNLVLVARSGDKLAQIADQLQGDFGIVVRSSPLDLTAAPAVQFLFDQLQREKLAIDFLVNNAGYGILSEGTGALVVLGNSSVIGNGAGLGAPSGGSIQSYQNNQTKGNGFDGAPTSVLSLN